MGATDPFTGLELVVLGAGQEVGRSCVVMYAQGVNVMFDCGLHMGKQGDQRLPLLSTLGDINDHIHAVVITHFHLDHIGALPYLTEHLGYRGPVIMTHATKTLAPLILEDYFSICHKRGDVLYPMEDVSKSLARATGVNLEETINLCGLRCTAYYAGHVMGAAMFHCQTGSTSVLYTGDYNMVADRHLGAAKVPRLMPDIVITESTYATTLRDPRRMRERKLLEAVHATVKDGGKVLIPVFAVGSAQEMSLLIDSFWQRMHLDVPLFMAEGMASKAAALFASLKEWGSQGMQTASQAAPSTPARRFRVWRPEYVNIEGPCVLFATPGMLQGGISLQVFKSWAPDKNNLVIIPGTCAAGTTGNKLLHTKKKADCRALQLDGQEVIVRCKVEQMTFSAHTDAKGVLDLLQHVQPKAAVLVHGEPDKMQFLQQRIHASLSVPCYAPKTGESVHITAPLRLPIKLSEACMQQAMRDRGAQLGCEQVKELERHGSAGEHAIRVLLDQLKEEGVDMSAAELDEPVSEAEQLSQHLRACPATVADGELCTSGVMYGTQGESGNEVTLLPLESDAAADTTSAQYVKFAAQAVAEWMADTGVGTVRVQAAGDVLQAGSIIARMVSEEAAGPQWAAEASGTGSREWAWEVMWSGSGEDVPELLALQEALSRVPQGGA
eukprot:jgi/Ulvmu1/7502/UM037_0046.1